MAVVTKCVHRQSALQHATGWTGLRETKGGGWNGWVCDQLTQSSSSQLHRRNMRERERERERRSCRQPTIVKSIVVSTVRVCTKPRRSRRLISSLASQVNVALGILGGGMHFNFGVSFAVVVFTPYTLAARLKSESTAAHDSRRRSS